ncbi:MAG: glycosyltransferase [Candidatus Moranbacteria bacterium]|nr:glycosyltransferase [Candidatus Moranbacteria bacterium]
MRIALVHDYLVQYGGAERVLECFCELFPKAPIYTLVYNPEVFSDVFRDRDIRTSFLQKIPFTKSEHHFFPYLMPLAVEQFDLSYYDLVISDTSSFAKGVITQPKTLHLSYCHTPMRYAWDDCHKYTREFDYPAFVKKFIPFGMNYIRIWDRVASNRVDHFMANSNLVKKRIEKYYKRRAKVIYPPVFTDNFKFRKDRDKDQKGYYLMVGRLVSYKKFDLGVKVFNRLGLPLKIVGGGSLLKKLKAMSKENIEFLGPLESSGERLREVYANCKALVYPQEEDFGLVPLEAMAVGKPVIAYRAGGVLETVIDNRTGIFFEKQNAGHLIKAIRKFQNKEFDSSFIQRHAKKFGKQRFKEEVVDFVEHKLRQSLLD